MKKIYFLFSVLFLCFIPSVFSQNATIDSEIGNENSSALKLREITSIFTTTADTDLLQNKNTIINNRLSGVLIQQIGNYNEATIDVRSKSTAISLFQNGDNNDYLMVKNATKIKATIEQNGNSNSIYDHSYGTNYETNLQMIQNGNNLNIKNIGANSISRDMKVNQTGNGASIIIINKSN
jgi:competence protein ComGC